MHEKFHIVNLLVWRASRAYQMWNGVSPVKIEDSDNIRAMFWQFSYRRMSNSACYKHWRQTMYLDVSERVAPCHGPHQTTPIRRQESSTIQRPNGYSTLAKMIWYAGVYRPKLSNRPLICRSRWVDDSHWSVVDNHRQGIITQTRYYHTIDHVVKWWHLFWQFNFWNITCQQRW